MIMRRAAAEKSELGDRAYRHGVAWVMMAVAIALHVADEAVNDFLSVYNPTVLKVREHVPWLPLPTFDFGAWIGGLAAGVVLLLALSHLVFAGVQAMRLVSYGLGTLMALNALQHMVWSAYLWKPVPGVYSSPILLAGSLWLIIAAHRTLR